MGIYNGNIILFVFDHQDILFKEKYKNKSARNYKWDYTSPGIYYVTLCTYKHNNHFGKIVDDKLLPSEIGAIVNEEILKTFEIRRYLKLHEYVIMPNHVHLLIKLKYRHISFLRRDGINAVSNKNVPVGFRAKQNPMTENGLPKIIRWLKATTTFQIRKEVGGLFSWQSRYYDEIIKSEQQYWATRKYIKDNIVNWEKDENRMI